jgi:hypothetical protein
VIDGGQEGGKEPAETLLGRPSAHQPASRSSREESSLPCVFCYRIANEKLGNKLREQVKYIAKLTGEKE